MNDREDVKKPGRRAALKAIGAAGLGAGLAASCTTAQSAEPVKQTDATPNGYDVIIVGAGFTGITAARDLGQQGYSVLILEAQNRIGGRTFSSELDSHKVEMGGTWVHWFQPHIWSEITRYGAELKEMPAAERFLALNAGNETATDVDLATYLPQMGATYAQIFADASLIWPRPYDQDFSWDQIVAHDQITFKDRLDEVGATGIVRTMIEAQMLSVAQQPMDEISYVEAARFYALSGGTLNGFFDVMSRYKFADGTKGLLDSMLKDAGAKLSLSTVVTDIREADGGVSVLTEDGATYEAETAIVTVPFNTLGMVQFDPPLPPKMQGFVDEGMGTRGYKTFVEVEGDVGNIVGMGPEDIMLPMLFTYDKTPTSTLLVGFGTKFEDYDPNDRAAAQECISYYLPDVKVLQAYGYSWSLDPFAQGFHGVYRTGQLSRIKDTFNTHEGRVLITGADHVEGWRSFIDGAVAAGSIAARHVDQLLTEAL
ncbi:MAG: NAD(P)/FAD-dependent oxidoreductase [Pseudomonadota bacterium]